MTDVLSIIGPEGRCDVWYASLETFVSSVYFKLEQTGSSTQTYHTGLGNRVGEQNEEDTQHCSDLDGETAWLALKPEETEGKHKEQVNEAPVYRL